MQTGSDDVISFATSDFLSNLSEISVISLNDELTLHCYIRTAIK